jgi:SAM-dependent methyltransferase
MSSHSPLHGPNVDAQTVRSFGDEWTAFDQKDMPEGESLRRFEEYFAIFPWGDLPADAIGADIGCGSGRWARHVAPRVGTLHCIDPSKSALEVARRNLSKFDNCRFHLANADDTPLARGSLDFCYALGVLHHVPDTAQAMRSCVAMLKPGAPFLVYLYYALDNRPPWFRMLWRVTDSVRRGMAGLPFVLKRRLSDAIALAVYWPLARMAGIVEAMGGDPGSLPLGYYRDKSFYTMRTDALDRFGTRLEKRFRRAEIEEMMRDAGLERIEFSERPPFWCAIGYRAD